MSKKSFLFKSLSVFLVIITILAASSSAFGCSDYLETRAQRKQEYADSIVDQMIEIARAQKGFYPSNINQFTTWYYGVETEAAWCSIYISWCADQVGALGTAVPKRALVGSMREWFERRGEYYPATSDYVPQKGDIMFINTALDGTDNVHHVDLITEDGFVKIGKGKGVKCISGNTSNIYYQGSEYVTEKTRPVTGPNATIVGYAHPSYEKCDSIIAETRTFLDDITLPYAKFLYAKMLELLAKLETLFAFA